MKDLLDFVRLVKRHFDDASMELTPDVRERMDAILRAEAAMRTKKLCPNCNGNGEIRRPTGVSTCAECGGYGWAPAAGPSSSDALRDLLQWAQAKQREHDDLAKCKNKYGDAGRLNHESRAMAFLEIRMHIERLLASPVPQVRDRVEKVLAEWEQELNESGVGIRGVNERSLIRQVREALVPVQPK